MLLAHLALDDGPDGVDDVRGRKVVSAGEQRPPRLLRAPAPGVHVGGALGAQSRAGDGVDDIVDAGAVVAEEVRKLAEDSGQAANNVKGLITTLQTDAGETVNSSTESSELLTRTTEKADKAKESLNKAMNQINKANDRIQNIAAVAEEQAASSREIASASTPRQNRRRTCSRTWK